MVNKNLTGTRVGYGWLLFAVFLVLKLAHVIDWSWLWVTAPVWIPLGVALVLLAVAGVASVVVAKVDKK